MSQLTEEEAIELKSIFDDFDEDKSGNVCVTELRKIAQYFGLNPTEGDVKDKLAAYDMNMDNVLSFEELKNLVADMRKEKQEMRAEIIGALQTLTHGLMDDGGGVTKEELFNHLMAKGDDPLTIEDIEDIFRDLDKNGDEKISAEELADILSS